MTVEALLPLAQEALMLTVVVSLPVVGAVFLSGLLVSLFQSMTGVTDGAVAHLPRLLVGALALGMLGPWMGAHVVAFAARVFALGS
ncbi:MAG TPA: flagellar biosynthetic protein FliQ [Polyangiaceae bacterium]|nr:flagellar biosynthetic protein FliQ [Polyangiaceae bacterium]